ncbi:MAG TPA: cation-translocating P-type ATPase C-terminal domain-containing protein, partial [Ottowia sp.]|uniref:cation-translocating P-type ATPase C-terminal domain-containing protein n=1 Tax=Ottowia sp. TaxID=1898956 RepID=UPI002C3DCC8A
LTEMVIDPICSLAFEGAPPEPRLMQRPPRRADEGLLGTSRLLDGLLQGGSVLLATLLVYILALRAGQDADVARTLAVVGLTAGNLLLVAANLSADLGWRALLTPGARAFWIVALIAAGVLALAIAVPQARALLHFAPAAPAQLGLTLVAVALAAAVGMLPGRALARRPRSTPA